MPACPVQYINRTTLASTPYPHTYSTHKDIKLTLEYSGLCQGGQIALQLNYTLTTCSNKVYSTLCVTCFSAGHVFSVTWFWCLRVTGSEDSWAPYGDDSLFLSGHECGYCNNVRGIIVE